MTTRTPRLDHPDGELRWVGDPRWSSVTTPTTRAVIGDHHHLLVVAAHPDDECLGAGAFIADAAALGVDVTLLILTSGEASHPRSSTVSREDLGARRRAEGEQAAAELAAGRTRRARRAPRRRPRRAPGGDLGCRRLLLLRGHPRPGPVDVGRTPRS